MSATDHLHERKIIHIDMDAFYASVEQLDNPKLVGLPLAVGGGGERGVVMAASYEARKFNVRSALSGRIAKERCPELIFVEPRMARYKEISDQIRSIFYEFTDLVEPLALDEAFLDVTENKINNPSASLIAKEIRNKIFTTLGLRASAGISVNKFLAKIATDINKPNGQKTINPNEVIAFLEQLPVSKFFGVGKVTAEKMHKIGIFTGADLKTKSLQDLIHHFGKAGKQYYNIVRGISISEVNPDRIRKSVAVENTFIEDLSHKTDLQKEIEIIATQLEKRMRTTGLKGRTVTVKIKYNDFSIQSRSKTVNHYMDAKKDFLPIALELMNQEDFVLPIRLLGLSFKNLDNQSDPGMSKQLIIDYAPEQPG